MSVTVAADISRTSAALLGSGHALRALGVDRRCRALAAAAHALATPTHALARELRVDVERGTGLSRPMIEWCLSTTLASVHERALLDLAYAQAREGDALALAAVVLAGNVFTASVRALFLPLLAGVPVLAKASSASDALPRHLQHALVQCDAEVGNALSVVQFGRTDQAATDALLERAEVVSIYGDDATVAELSTRAADGATVLPHGHGLSASYVSAGVLQTEALAEQAAARTALDIAAYDQRGCLSPHFVLVEKGANIDAQAFARELAGRALPRAQELLPLGTLEVEDKAACLQWRAVAAARGELYFERSHAVSFEGHASLRPSPGARHVAVHACAGVTDLTQQLGRFGEHLKSIGVAGDRGVRDEVTAVLRGPRPPRVCRAGEMQTPPLAADVDGLPALEGFFRRR